MYALLLASPTEPEFAGQVAESFLVGFPVAIEVDGAILSSLEDLTKDDICILWCKGYNMFGGWNV